jgi:hypothetical protein
MSMGLGKATTAVLVVVVLGGAAGSSGAADSSGVPAPPADALPFFKPDPKPVMYGPPLPDPDVPECAANDRECLEAHDAAALSAALADENDASCDGSRHPDACRAAYEMITGNVGMRADPILDDPCSWVVLVDRGIATIQSKRTGSSRRYLDRGWKPRTFLGKCDLSRLSSRGGEAAVPLPTWVARRSAASQPARLPSPATVATSATMATPATTAAPATVPPVPPVPAPEAAAPVAAKKP